MATISEALSIALQHHQAGRLQEAEALYRQILQVQPDHPDALHLLGVIAHQVGKQDIAISYIVRAIGLKPDVAEYYNNIGEAYRALGKLDEAMDHYRRALQLKPTYAEAHNNAGVALEAQGKLKEAEANYRQAIMLKPTYAEPHCNLGNVLNRQGKLDEAMGLYRQAVALKPTYAEAHGNLGAVLQAQGKLDEAVVHYRQALALKPTYAEVYRNLGNVLRMQGKLVEAVAYFRQVIALQPTFAEAYNELGVCFTSVGNVEEAAVYYQKAIALNPSFAVAYKNLGASLKDQGNLEEAVAQYRKALALVPNDGLRILIATLLPIIPESKDHLLEARRNYEQQVSQLLEQNLVLTDPSIEVGATHFYLAYQGLNDRDLQRLVCQLYEKACPSLNCVAPHCRSLRSSRSEDKIKVGFLSRFLRDHTIGRLNRGIMANLSRNKFSVSMFLFHQMPDPISEFIVRHADRTIMLPANLDEARRLIAQEQLDILFYPDIGMDPFSYFLAFSRLAPIQCVTWGHPDTTGIPTIDYFVSSEHLEPDDADQHYTERLTRLKHLPTYYYKPDVPPGFKSRGDFGLEEGRIIYLCPQSLFKFHPDFDELIAGVLRAHPEGQVVIIEGLFKYFTKLLMQRFRNTMPDVVDRIRILPRQSSRDFIGLLSVVDVILDPLKWSGGSTTYEALSFGTPIVTMPSEFMRGRVTYACYKQMGVMDCVAMTKEDYVKLAVRLGTDPAYRAEVKAKLLAANVVLYENAEAVRDLERFFVKALEDARQRHS